MTQGQSNQEFHAQYCAVKNVRVALFLVAFFAWEVFLSWEVLDKAFSRSSLYDEFWRVVTIAACAKFLAMFRCFPERFVVGVVMLRLVIGLVCGFFPILINPVAGLVRSGNLGLDVFALITSLGMAVLSTQRVESARP
jgi:hypothetical protein